MFWKMVTYSETELSEVKHFKHWFYVIRKGCFRAKGRAIILHLSSRRIQIPHFLNEAVEPFALVTKLLLSICFYPQLLSPCVQSQS